MIRDYKSIPVPSPTPRSGFGSGLVLGLAIGLVCAAIVYVYHNMQTSAPEEYACAETPVPTPQVAPKTAPAMQVATKDCEIPDSEVRKVLLNPQVPLISWEAEYMLQGAAYPTNEEATQMKKKVLGLGYKSTIGTYQEVENVWYRIEIGPYRELQGVNEVRQHLKNMGIEMSVKKRMLKKQR